jgi:hypothetical protein
MVFNCTCEVTSTLRERESALISGTLSVYVRRPAGSADTTDPTATVLCSLPQARELSKP